MRNSTEKEKPSKKVPSDYILNRCHLLKGDNSFSNGNPCDLGYCVSYLMRRLIFILEPKFANDITEKDILSTLKLLVQWPTIGKPHCYPVML